MGVLLWSIAPSATIMIFSLFIPARFYKEGWWRDNMTEKLRLWLWRGLSEARRPDDANSHRAEDRLFHNDRLCLHFMNDNILQTFLSVSTSLIRSGVDLFYTHINNLLHSLTQNVMAENCKKLSYRKFGLFVAPLSSIIWVSMLLASPLFALRYSHLWQN